jgi:hypothetical protein
MKKVLKYGCLSILGVVVLIVIVGVLITNDKSNNEAKEITKTEKKQSKPILTDSIWKTIVPNNFRVESDEFKKTSFYSHPLTPKYNNIDWIFPYIGKNGNNIYLRLKLQYEDDNWLFIKKVQFLIDGEVVDFASGNFDRDNDGGRIWEWADMSVGESTIKILEMISESSSAKVRYTGAQYYDDREITSREKRVIRQTLMVYNKSQEFK